MKLRRSIIVIILAFLATLLDISFFSFLEISGVTILFSFVMVVILSLDNDWETVLAFGSALSILFAVFSSLPIFAIFILFFALPAAIYYFRKNFLPEGSLAATVIIFLIANLLADAVMLIAASEFSLQAFLNLGYFVLYNTIFGVVLWAGLQKIASNWKRGEIKI